MFDDENDLILEGIEEFSLSSSEDEAEDEEDNRTIQMNISTTSTTTTTAAFYRVEQEDYETKTPPSDKIKSIQEYNELHPKVVELIHRTNTTISLREDLDALANVSVQELTTMYEQMGQHSKYNREELAGLFKSWISSVSLQHRNSLSILKGNESPAVEEEFELFVKTCQLEKCSNASESDFSQDKMDPTFNILEDSVEQIMLGISPERSDILENEESINQNESGESHYPIHYEQQYFHPDESKFNISQGSFSPIQQPIHDPQNVVRQSLAKLIAGKADLKLELRFPKKDERDSRSVGTNTPRDTRETTPIQTRSESNSPRNYLKKRTNENRSPEPPFVNISKLYLKKKAGKKVSAEEVNSVLNLLSTRTTAETTPRKTATPRSSATSIHQHIATPRLTQPQPSTPSSARRIKRTVPLELVESGRTFRAKNDLELFIKQKEQETQREIQQVEEQRKMRSYKQ